MRWLEAISRTGAAISGGPNFAYDLCVRKATPERVAGLDLSRWRVAFNGAEPVRAETLDRFAEAFAPCGFRREAFFPCYGLAEATLLVSGGPWQSPPVVVSVRAEGLEQGRLEPAEVGDEAARSLVGCGRVAEGLEVIIVDPETGARTPRRAGRRDLGRRARASPGATGGGPRRPSGPSAPARPTPARGRSSAPATWASSATASCSSPAGSRT